jgi:hypothetical protein
LFDSRAPENLCFDKVRLVNARFSLSRAESVPFQANFREHLPLFSARVAPSRAKISHSLPRGWYFLFELMLLSQRRDRQHSWCTRSSVESGLWTFRRGLVERALRE